jgi:hypothetical protein
MPKLLESLRAWRSEAFAAVLKGEIEGLPPGILPLNEAASAFVDESSPVTVRVLAVEEAEEEIRAKIGVFFSEILTGCSCGYEPEPQSAYCEIQARLDKTTGEAGFALLG